MNSQTGRSIRKFSVALSLAMACVPAPSTVRAEGARFSPDRPGIGESTGTPGAGHLLLETDAFLSTGDAPTLGGTSGISLRYGIGDVAELRARVPGFVADSGEVSTGVTAVGFKVGGAVSNRWSLSSVSEFPVDTNDGDVSGLINGNLALDLAAVDVRAHVSAAVASGASTSVLAGGGVSYGWDTFGAYTNAGHTFGGASMTGVGGWLMLTPDWQIDAGVDVFFGDRQTQTFLMVGTSVVF